MKMATYEAEVGIMYSKKVKGFLDRCKANGLKLEYTEENTPVQTTFKIKGPFEDMMCVKHSLENFLEEIESI